MGHCCFVGLIRTARRSSIDKLVYGTCCSIGSMKRKRPEPKCDLRSTFQRIPTFRPCILCRAECSHNRCNIVLVVAAQRVWVVFNRVGRWGPVGRSSVIVSRLLNFCCHMTLPVLFWLCPNELQRHSLKMILSMVSRLSQCWCFECENSISDNMTWSRSVYLSHQVLFGLRTALSLQQTCLVKDVWTTPSRKSFSKKNKTCLPRALGLSHSKSTWYMFCLWVPMYFETTATVDLQEMIKPSERTSHFAPQHSAETLIPRHGGSGGASTAHDLVQSPGDPLHSCRDQPCALAVDREWRSGTTDYNRWWFWFPWFMSAHDSGTLESRKLSLDGFPASRRFTLAEAWTRPLICSEVVTCHQNTSRTKVGINWWLIDVIQCQKPFLMVHHAHTTFTHIWAPWLKYTDKVHHVHILYDKYIPARYVACNLLHTKTARKCMHS